jgi:hypothetical protein
MDINFEWPGDCDHDALNELFMKYAKIEAEFIMSALADDPMLFKLEGADHD